MKNASRFAEVGDTIPDYGVITHIKDIFHESYFMQYTFSDGRRVLLRSVRIHPDGSATYQEHDAYLGVD